MPASSPIPQRPGELHGQRDRYPPEDRSPDVHDPAAAGAARTPTTARTDATTANPTAARPTARARRSSAGWARSSSRRLYPGSAKATVGVSLPCSSAGSDEEAMRQLAPRGHPRPERRDDLLEAGQHRAGRALRPAGDRPGGRDHLSLRPGRARRTPTAARAVDLAAGSRYFRVVGTSGDPGRPTDRPPAPNHRGRSPWEPKPASPN